MTVKIQRTLSVTSFQDSLGLKFVEFLSFTNYEVKTSEEIGREKGTEVEVRGHDGFKDSKR